METLGFSVSKVYSSVLRYNENHTMVILSIEDNQGNTNKIRLFIDPDSDVRPENIGYLVSVKS